MYDVADRHGNFIVCRECYNKWQSKCNNLELQVNLLEDENIKLQEENEGLRIQVRHYKKAMGKN